MTPNTPRQSGVTYSGMCQSHDGICINGGKVPSKIPYEVTVFQAMY